MTDRPPCPICRRPNALEYRPFCSKRCADVDLGRWLTGRYAIAGEPDAEEDADSTQDAHVGAEEHEENEDRRS